MQQQQQQQQQQPQRFGGQQVVLAGPPQTGNGTDNITYTIGNLLQGLQQQPGVTPLYVDQSDYKRKQSSGNSTFWLSSYVRLNNFILIIQILQEYTLGKLHQNDKSLVLVITGHLDADCFNYSEFNYSESVFQC